MSNTIEMTTHILQKQAAGALLMLKRVKVGVCSVFKIDWLFMLRVSTGRVDDCCEIWRRSHPQEPLHSRGGRSAGP